MKKIIWWAKPSLVAGFALALSAWSERAETWRIESAPALTPGEGDAWDSQSIRYPCVVRMHDRWMMIYQGTAIDEAGPHTAFGCAQSDDAIAWKKLRTEPVFSPDTGSDQLAEAPIFTTWKNGFLLLYLVNTFLVPDEKSLRERDGSRPEVRLARSADAIQWRDQPTRHLPIASESHIDFAPCIYADNDLLYLWWLAVANDKPVLCHSVSRDGSAWSKPSIQLTSEIDSRPISGARVYPSGAFYLLTYVAEAEDETKREKSYFLVTKVSRDARSWTRRGPPEFALPQLCVPFMVFTPAGARLFYDEHERTRDKMISTRAILRSAFCPKAAYENR
jgi:hypothetical protein